MLCLQIELVLVLNLLICYTNHGYLAQDVFCHSVFSVYFPIVVYQQSKNLLSEIQHHLQEQSYSIAQ